MKKSWTRSHHPWHSSLVMFWKVFTSAVLRSYFCILLLLQANKNHAQLDSGQVIDLAIIKHAPDSWSAFESWFSSLPSSSVRFCPMCFETIDDTVRYIYKYIVMSSMSHELFLPFSILFSFNYSSTCWSSPVHRMFFQNCTVFGIK